MIGIIYYLLFLVLGFIYSKYIFKKNFYFHLWIGMILGNVILMFGIIIPSFIFDFTIISHIILLIIAIIPLIIIIIKKGFNSFKKRVFTFLNDGEMSGKIFLLLIIPIFFVIAILLTNHILVPLENGAVASGQSTYGDLNMHLGFITSIAEQKVFPPNYAFLSGTKLNYPFLVDSLSSSLYLFGTSLRMSILIPSYVLSLSLVMGFYFLSYKITSNKRAAIISCIFFFLGGGLGFIYFLDGAKGDIASFTRIFTDYYHTPTNFNEMNIRWANPICDMIIPQRTTMAGWFMLMPTLWLLIEGSKTGKRKYFVILALLASTMPMIHTHSFLALGVISLGMMIIDLIIKKDKKQTFYNYLIYGLIVILIAFPQLFYWTFSQTIGNESFLKYHFNWVNKVDPYIWFYVKNWGITFIFLIPAFIYADKDNKKIIISAFLLFLLAEFIIFQPNEYDNNKLFFVSYMIFIIMVSNYLIYLFNKLKGVKGRIFFSIIIIILGTLSGVLTIGREYKSGGIYQTFSHDMIKMSDYIKKNTDSESIFLTSDTHINPIVSLAGRNIYVGSSLYVYFHGFIDEYNNRSMEIHNMYFSNYEELKDFCKENNITYIYYGDYEKAINDNWYTINYLEKVIGFGSEELYKIGANNEE